MLILKHNSSTRLLHAMFGKDLASKRNQEAKHREPKDSCYEPVEPKK